MIPHIGINTPRPFSNALSIPSLSERRLSVKAGDVLLSFLQCLNILSCALIKNTLHEAKKFVNIFSENLEEREIWRDLKS